MIKRHDDMPNTDKHALVCSDAHLNEQQYQALYRHSVDDPETFWAEQATRFINWFKPWTQVKEGDFANLNVQWFIEGKLNACYNCLDRHLPTRAQQTALIWEGNEPHDSRTFTYQELFYQVCKLANVLKKHGVKKGARVGIYLPMIPEAVIALLACARIGAIHSVVFAGFSPESLKKRLIDADCMLLITADEGLRGDKTTPLKHHCDEALKECPTVQSVIVIQHTGNAVSWHEGRDHWYHEEMEEAALECPPEEMDASDPLFILYTSGSTGKPKGVLHATGGYMVYAALTHYYVFNYHNEDVYWCTADIGWITGHTYLVYGPLANGAITVQFEGVPQHPDFSRLWQIIDKHQVNIFYTAPTVLRALRREGDEWVKKASRKSLKLLGTVGEPINPQVWHWYYKVVGENRCPIVDTWWQTETGGILLSALPGATPMIPGSASWPFFGIIADVVDENGASLPPYQHGRLVIKQPWPGLMKTIYGDNQRFIKDYFQPVSGCYLTGDEAYYDENGCFWILGRFDDVINVSGHRLGSEELESALLTHHAVSEAAVVGVPNEITGESIHAFITTKVEITPNGALKAELIAHVRQIIGAVAKLQSIEWAPALPKTRSGKIMRRVLRKIARNEWDDLGDVSTLADPGVLDQFTRKK